MITSSERVCYAIIFAIAVVLIVWNLFHGQARAQYTNTIPVLMCENGAQMVNHKCPVTDQEVDQAMAVCDGHKVTAPDQTPIYDTDMRAQCEAIHKRYVEVRVPKLAQERADAEKARREFVDKIAKKIQEEQK